MSDSLIQRAMELREQGRYTEAAEIVRLLRDKARFQVTTRQVRITITAEYAISAGDDAYNGALDFEEAVEIDRQAIADGKVGLEDVLAWGDKASLEIDLELLPDTGGCVYCNPESANLPPCDRCGAK